MLTELLPLDERRREESIVLGDFAWAAIGGQGITAEETFAAPRALVTIVADQLRRAQPHSLPVPRNPERDASWTRLPSTRRRPIVARNRRRSAGSTDISSSSALNRRRNPSFSTSAFTADAEASTGPVESHFNREVPIEGR
ncbi:hypothetical protein OG405_11325 [Nocardia sp. NBC_01329]|nr:hypothetical protein OG405_11325 [Nocardia sp. NBC_01329]